MDTAADLDKTAEAEAGVDEKRVTFTPQQGGVSSRRRFSDPRWSTRSINASFKSPVQKTDDVKSAVSFEEEARDLRITLKRLNSEIAQLEKDGFVEQELDQHIDLLHEYNDIKDIGQTLLGRLARLRGVTTRDLYSHFGLELDD